MCVCWHTWPWQDEIARGLRCEFAIDPEVLGLCIGKNGTNITRALETGACLCWPPALLPCELTLVAEGPSPCAHPAADGACPASPLRRQA